MRSPSFTIPLLTVGVAMALFALPVPTDFHSPRAALPLVADGTILRHSDISDVTVAVRPTGAPVPPSGAGSTNRSFWVASGRRGEYREVSTVFVGDTGSLRVWAQDSTDVPATLMLEAANQVEATMYSGLLGVLAEKALQARDDLFPVDVVFADLSAMGGYFSSADQSGSSGHPYSNQTNAIYVSLASCNLTGGCSAPLIAHELQHLLQYAVDPQEQTWFNEGLSELAEGSVPSEPLQCSDFPLFEWSSDPDLTGLHYRSAASFLSFWREALGEEALYAVAVDPLPGTEALSHYLHLAEDPRTLDDLFLQWSWEQVASWLPAERETPTAPGAHQGTSLHIFDEPGGLADSVNQYGCDIIIVPYHGDIELRFDGEAEAAVLPGYAPGHDYAWWSGGQSNGHATLTAILDLAGMASPHLRYWTWYDIEQWYDWAYAAVSADGGESWRWLRAPAMTTRDPFGNSPGVGYTGASHRWRLQELDLSAYAGEQVLLRFGYLTDDAIESVGFALSGAELIDPRGQETSPPVEWKSQGFILLSPWTSPLQKYSVSVLEDTVPGGVRELPLDERNDGHWLLPAGQAQAVMVCALTAGALPAPYRVEVSYAEAPRSDQSRATPERLAD